MEHSFPPPPLFLFFLIVLGFFFKINMFFSNVFTIDQKKREGAAGKPANCRAGKQSPEWLWLCATRITRHRTLPNVILFVSLFAILSNWIKKKKKTNPNPPRAIFGTSSEINDRLTNRKLFIKLICGMPLD